MALHHEVMPTTAGAAWYLLRLSAGARLVAAGRHLTKAGATTEAVLVGAGHRLAVWGSRCAEVRPTELIEPIHPLARRVAGLPELPRRTVGALGLCTGVAREEYPPDDQFRWLNGGQHR